MDITEQITTAMMNGHLDPTTGGDLLDLAMLTNKDPLCFACRKVTGIHGGAMVTADEGKRGLACGPCLDKLKPQIEAKGHTFLDGREFDENFRRKAPVGKKPPRKKPKPKIANRNVNGHPVPIKYSRKFQASGLTWFVARCLGTSGDWRLYHWESGLALTGGRHARVADCIKRAETITEYERGVVAGAMSLHRINPSDGGRS